MGVYQLAGNATQWRHGCAHPSALTFAKNGRLNGTLGRLTFLAYLGQRASQSLGKLACQGLLISPNAVDVVAQK